jgi:1-aminocyclopropane-1-carboxylate deaminase/D-cysteine desulfhydrase-like pyridoxal-dependent ACC family enzyme
MYRCRVIDESNNCPVCGGNKIRKIKYILAGEGIRGILTYGSKYSSHCLASAYWGALNNIPVRLLVLEQDEINFSNYPNLKMSINLGADLVRIPQSEADDRIKKEKKSFSSYFWIPGGGHTEEGLKAYRDWFGKLLDEDSSLGSRDWVALPYGTGTTALGILRAIHDRGLSMEVIGVSVSRSKDRCLEAAQEFVSGEELDLLTIDDRFEGKYGERTSRQEKLRHTFLEETGILPDPIYNTRVVEYLEEEDRQNGVVVNTGGRWNNLL